MEPAVIAAASVVVQERVLRLPHYLWIVGTVLVIGAMLHWLGPILTPFLIGAMLAYLGNPAVNWGQRRKLSRTIGTLLIMMIMLVLIVTLVLVLFPLMQSEFVQLARRLPEIFATAYAQVAPWLEERFGIVLQLDMPAVRRFIAQGIGGTQDASVRLMHGLRVGGTMVLAIIINLMLIPVVMFYLLRDWNIIVRRFGRTVAAPLVRQGAHDRDRDRRRARRVPARSAFGDGRAGHVLRDRAVSIAGLQYAVPIGILTGLLVFIPYVGFGLGLVLGVVAALLQWHGLARIPRGARRVRRSGSCSKATCWCRGWSAIASDCIRWR